MSINELVIASAHVVLRVIAHLSARINRSGCVGFASCSCTGAQDPQASGTAGSPVETPGPGIPRPYAAPA